MKPLIVAFDGSETLARRLAQALEAEMALPVTRQFPDEETYLRLEATCKGRDVVVVGSLDRPNGKILPLLFLTDLAHELGAGRVILVAPYLPYMRQDKRFKPGEAVTSRSFSKLLSASMDALVTIDPHLHRYGDLAELYSIPTEVVHAAPVIAQWIRAEIERPLLIGPDSESEQWVADVARRASAPHVVLEKIRRGDREVEVSVPDVERWLDHRPILVDDIISSARTMIETVGHLMATQLAAPICIGVHAVFADDGYHVLQSSGVERIVTTNTIPHESNGIDIADAVGTALKTLIETE